jgi:hypothetical protein
MPKFLFTYRVPNIPLEQRLAELGPSAGAGTMALWNSWIESLGTHLLDHGNRVSDARMVGRCQGDTRSSGYNVITADTLDAAVALAGQCPFLEKGGGVEVGVIPEQVVP